MKNDTLFFVDQDSLYYARTALGEANFDDPSVGMSPAFRRMLRELDGTRSIAQLAKLFPHLDHEDLQMWIGELLHQQLIMPVVPMSEEEQARLRAPAQQPAPAAPAPAAPQAIPPQAVAPRVAAPQAPAQAPVPGATQRMTSPNARVTPPAGVTPLSPPLRPQTEQRLRQIAQELAPWLAEMGRASNADAAPGDDISRTARMVAVEASSTEHSLGREGFFMSPDGPRQPLAPGARRLILVVEDDQLQATMAKRILETEGYTVRVAADGAEANKAMVERPVPDLVLLDVELPDTDGFTLLKQIRAHPMMQLLRVVMLTARADRADIAKGVLLGADGYLTKPYRPEMIKMAVRQAMPG